MHGFWTEFWQAHAEAFITHPFKALAVLWWGIWYIGYKARAARTEVDDGRCHGHRRRMVAGALTILVGLIWAPYIVMESDIQAERQRLSNEHPELSVPTPMATTAQPSVAIAPAGGTAQSNSAIALPTESHLGPQSNEVSSADDGDFIYALIDQLKTDEISKQAFVTKMTSVYHNMSNGYLDLDSDIKKYSGNHSALIGTLEIMRNLPYAEHGYAFKQPMMRGLFEQFPWYHADEPSAAIVQMRFNQFERTNIKAIIKAEQ